MEKLLNQKELVAEEELDAPVDMHAVNPKSLELYAVTDSSWLGERTLVECVTQAIAGGATFIQLREKHLDHASIVKLGFELKPICAAAGVPFVIDDDIMAAAEVGADGVHVGQYDVACEDARRILGPGKIVGVSAQTVDQALKAQDDGADYLGVGALFATATKRDAIDVSVEQLKAICAAVDIPVVGIGGLNERTIPLLQYSGAVGAAVVSAIFAADDCKAATAQLRAVADSTFK
jgi:thiamine-phosphate diphosphorylase